MARDDPMMRFRAPKDLKSKIEESASQNGRSLNAEIVHRLEASFAASEGIPLEQAVPVLSAEDVTEMLNIFSRAHLRTRGGN
ncbi:Arc family DNA-binding protein [Gluconobacter albidus]|uniref:Arc family DNA-binding protein n=1 Tax=Gluconobacter albidus TaxID=318683 RepID=UPI00209EAF8D|nr:Arc family DNA-binding protein [Gluconobacter albidus]MCP1274814.1 Arc family DNA-binding protein [Gluconobacter albidus]